MRRIAAFVVFFGFLTSALSAEDSATRSSVCVAESSRDSLLLPAVAHVEGKFGSKFASDVSIANYRSAAQLVRARWLPETGVAIIRLFTIPARSTLRYNDFLWDELGVSGVGALLLEGVTPGETVDSSAHIDATSRIWTTQPGGSGTMSQTLSSRAAADLVGPTAAHAMGMTQDENFRTNVGIVNLENSALTFSVRAEGQFRTESATILVGPMAMRQIAIPDGIFGETIITVLPLTSRADGFYWSAYAASVDNRTGDGWVVHAVQP